MRFGMGQFGLSLTPWVRRLLIANGTLALLGLIHVIPLGFQVRWLSFVPAEILLRPWGILTYMFVHGSVWHVLMNGLVLFFFGPPVEQRLGGAEFLRFYVACGMGGALLGFFFAFGTPVIGASAAVFGLMVAFAWYWPDAPIYLWAVFPVRAKYLVGGLIVLTLISTFADASSVTAHFAHLGGIVAALGYLKLRGPGGVGPRLGRVGSAVQNFRFVRVSSEGATQGEGARPREGLRSRDGARSDSELARLDEVDRILDKISASGMASLTVAERAVLDAVSRRERTN